MPATARANGAGAAHCVDPSIGRSGLVGLKPFYFFISFGWGESWRQGACRNGDISTVSEAGTRSVNASRNSSAPLIWGIGGHYTRSPSNSLNKAQKGQAPKLYAVTKTGLRPSMLPSHPKSRSARIQTDNPARQQGPFMTDAYINRISTAVLPRARQRAG